jgi:hypothetical protein
MEPGIYAFVPHNSTQFPMTFAAGDLKLASCGSAEAGPLARSGVSGRARKATDDQNEHPPVPQKIARRLPFFNF